MTYFVIIEPVLVISYFSFQWLCIWHYDSSRGKPWDTCDLFCIQEQTQQDDIISISGCYLIGRSTVSCKAEHARWHGRLKSFTTLLHASMGRMRSKCFSKDQVLTAARRFNLLGLAARGLLHHPLPALHLPLLSEKLVMTNRCQIKLQIHPHHL